MAFFHFLKKILLCCDSDIFSTTSCIDFEDDNEGNVWRQKHSVQVKIQKMYNLGKSKQFFDISKLPIYIDLIGLIMQQVASYCAIFLILEHCLQRWRIFSLLQSPLSKSQFPLYFAGVVFWNIRDVLEFTWFNSGCSA